MRMATQKDHSTSVNSSQCFSSKERAETSLVSGKYQEGKLKWRPSRRKNTNTTFGVYTIMSNSVSDFGFEIFGKGRYF